MRNNCPFTKPLELFAVLLICSEGSFWFMSDSESQIFKTEFQTSVFENAFQKAWDGLISDGKRVTDLQHALGQLPDDKEWMNNYDMNEHKEMLFQIILDNHLSHANRQ
ncbi:hypothetical protein VKT23_013561 [Stygiomarasmius scandens]|uniref:Uncharacterized protein n=1 Tax=Marasmiellus scandens TaxID=2682957 RepID=A0ABR1J6J4_9AGAR